MHVKAIRQKNRVYGAPDLCKKAQNITQILESGKTAVRFKLQNRGLTFD